MVNYKIVNTAGNWKEMPEAPGYVESAGDILEVKTSQIVKSGLGMRKAKELCRHLNFGGGFDGFTPVFFLENNTKISQLTEEAV